MSERSESDLIEDILAGEHSLYEYFIRKYNQRLFRTGMSILNNDMEVEDAIAGLPEKYRLVFVLREVEDLSVKETAEVLLLEESNIKVRLNRAKTILRENLSGYVKETVFAFHFTRCDRIVGHVFKEPHIEHPLSVP
jgi:Sigma-70, region 4